MNLTQYLTSLTWKTAISSRIPQWTSLVAASPWEIYSLIFFVVLKKGLNLA